ncbi:MAG: cytochrome c biogenesis heme-transporting ATPase CcmA [Burkholderiales bacterium]|nr:cytochrome c biogenesis heme-transporting ATPase CcmA [Burkholderiales bacterium]
MLEAANLECVRGDRTLFSGLSFSLNPGELLRVAGTNGSGKTSLLRILCGLLSPTHGEVRWQGGNIGSLREEYWKEIIYLGHSSAVKDGLTAMENLMVSCTLAGLTIDHEQARAALRCFGLAECEDLPAKVLSQGQRRRVSLARLILSDKLPLWILDEPFTALDTAAVDYMQTLIAEHVARGATVVLTTHQEAQIAAATLVTIDLTSRIL